MPKWFRDCAICGEPVQLSRERYLATAGPTPKPVVCRRNGCHLYARDASGEVAAGVAGLVFREKRTKKTKGGGPLARLRVSYGLTDDCERRPSRG